VRLLLPGCLLLLCGCEALQTQMQSQRVAAEPRVLICKGGGAYVTCRYLNAWQYKEAARSLHRPVTGTRISPRRERT
jgi:hypothetical protein